MRSRIRNKDTEPGGDEDNLYEGDEEKDKGHVDDGNHLYEDDHEDDDGNHLYEADDEDDDEEHHLHEDDTNHLYEDDEPPEVAKAEVGDKSRAER